MIRVLLENIHWENKFVPTNIWEFSETVSAKVISGDYAHENNCDLGQMKLGVPNSDGFHQYDWANWN